MHPARVPALLSTLAAALPLAAAAGTLAGLPGTWVPPAAATGAALLAGGVALGSARPDLEWFGPAIVRGPPEGDRVALTFDDGPDPASTPALLDALAEAEARATFFVLADRAARHPELHLRIARAQEVALHGPTHSARLAFLPPERGARLLLEARALLAAIAPTVSAFFRPPFGVVSPRLHRAAALAGLRLVWCSLRTHDGVIHDPERLLATCRRIRAGDIVLLHEGRGRPAARVLPRILDELAGRGLRPVTLGDLLATPSAASSPCA